MAQIFVKIGGSLLSTFLFISCLFGQANIQLHTDAPFQYRNSYQRFFPLRNTGPDTLSFSASQPFMDDFAYMGITPDTNKWYVPQTDLLTPVITKGMAINPPSRGVATFDGANRLGRPYNDAALTSGPADRLTSHFIDLSNFDASDQIKLSFFLQPKGQGEVPESNDSFFVFFRTPLPSPMDFQKVLAVGGGKSGGFQSYIISIDQPEYFHTQFQIIFESNGSLNGYLDHWHLDYVYMAPNRANNDTTFDDRSAISLLNSPLHPYTAIPVQHFNALGNIMKPFEVELGNLKNGSASVPITVKITDPIGGINFNSPFQQQTTVNFSAYGSKIEGFNAFANQNINQIAAIEFSVSIPSNHDQFVINNTFTETFGIDSVFAYDDGEADRSFGINRSLGFGVEYNLPKPDSLVAVWISFVPTVNFNPVSNQVTYMDDHAFRLVVYKNPHPDSLILQQLGGVKVRYGDKPDHFERYALSSPLPVPQTFWVGIQQVNSLPIGVGFDENYDNSSKTYWDSSGYWININLKGSLMIRPEMYNTASLPASLEDKILFQPGVSIYPNPVIQPQVTVHFKIEQTPIRYQATLMDINGQEILRINPQRVTSPKSTFHLPDNIKPGVYIWIHEMESHTGEKHIFSEKIFINQQ
ncbi:MAG: hypothetical protein KDE26_00675 [Bacteroidetes bacterium]|nr:hypothetical protein [Bacteroidota bacterium]